MAYDRDAIVEAILDIQVDPSPGLPLDNLLKCRQKVKDQYPNTKKAEHIAGEISVGDKLSSSASRESVGYVFLSADERQLFQARRNGFTFNRLAPYLGWTEFVREAQRLWTEYCRVVKPRAYNRIALRYINRYEFPTERINLETYFRTHVEVSRDLPQLLAGFFFRALLPIDEIKSAAIITQTHEQGPAHPNAVIILDIDVFKTEEMPPGEQLWAVFESLRKWKNKIYEASITEKLRGLFH